MAKKEVLMAITNLVAFVSLFLSINIEYTNGRILAPIS